MSSVDLGIPDCVLSWILDFHRLLSDFPGFKISMDGDCSFDAFGSVKKFHGKVKSMKIQFLRGVFIWREYLLFFEGRCGKIIKYVKFYLHWLYLNIFVNSACPFIIIKHQSCVRGEGSDCTSS